MTDIQDVIDQYHDLLSDEIAREADEKLRIGLKERGLYFGHRPLCIVLRPHFYFEEDWNYMKRSLETLLTAFMRAHEVCMENDAARALLHLDPYEEELLELDRGGPMPWSSSRLDTFYVVGPQRSLKVVEYNAETPAGIGYGDKLVEVFDELQPMHQIRKQYNISANQSLGTLYTALVDAYKAWGGRQNPQIGILDWHEVPTLNEHEISRIYFEKCGSRTTLADPRELEYHDGHLWKGDFRIDLIYKRVLYSELVERLGMDNAVVNALKDRSVYMTNSPSAKLMDKKASLAFLQDERQAHYFSKTQLEAIQAHIPWTRIVEERKTIHKGREIDLLPFIAENKDTLVLKPNDDYGGKGVTLGWEASADGWNSALNQALQSSFVVQESAPTVERDFPVWENGALDISPRYVDADPYVFGGQDVSGCLTRLSPLALLNVTAGGGSVVPTYVVRER